MHGSTSTRFGMMVLHGPCVVLICLQNEEAEELMRHVEQEEEEAAASDPSALQLHLCIINLVIGTLYCSKVCEDGGEDAGSLVVESVSE